MESAPTANMASATPDLSNMAAKVMASSPEAQAVLKVKLGPRRL